MSPDRRLASTLAPLTREVPLDLLALAAVVLCTWATLVVALPPGNPLVVPLAVGFVLVAPGYAVVAALFPARRTAHSPEGHRLAVRGLDFPERLALGVGTSVVVAPFVAFVLQSTVVGVARTPVLLILGAGTLVAVGVAVRRWRALPPELRYRVGVSLPRGATDRLLVVVVAVAVVLAVSSVGYATTTARGGEDLTELYVLAVQDDGTLLADNYPSNLQLGETARLFVGLDNHRGTETTYTVVGLLQQVDTETGAVVRQDEFQRYTATVADEGSWGVTHDVTPRWAGVNVRVVYLLYLEPPPAVVSRETAADSVHVWMDVVDPLAADPAAGSDPSATAAGAADADGTTNGTVPANGTDGTNGTAVGTNGTAEGDGTVPTNGATSAAGAAAPS